jgi:hypothetical protein
MGEGRTTSSAHHRGASRLLSLVADKLMSSTRAAVKAVCGADTRVGLADWRAAVFDFYQSCWRSGAE